jgi:hypothetical protein
MADERVTDGLEQIVQVKPNHWEVRVTKYGSYAENRGAAYALIAETHGFESVATPPARSNARVSWWEVEPVLVAHNPIGVKIAYVYTPEGESAPVCKHEEGRVGGSGPANPTYRF